MKQFTPVIHQEDEEFRYKVVSNGKYTIYLLQTDSILPNEESYIQTLDESGKEFYYELFRMARIVGDEYGLTGESDLVNDVLLETMTLADAIREKYQRSKHQELEGDSEQERDESPIVTVVLDEESRKNEGTPDILPEWEKIGFISSKYSYEIKSLQLKGFDKNQSNRERERVVTAFLRYRLLHHVLLQEPLVGNGNQRVSVKAKLSESIKPGTSIEFGDIVLQVAASSSNGKIHFVKSEFDIEEGSVGFVKDTNQFFQLNLGIANWSLEDTLNASWLTADLKDQILDFYIQEQNIGQKKLMPS